MRSTMKDFSVSELEKILETRKSELAKLLKNREKLLKDLQRVEKRIKTLEGRKTTGAKRKSRKRARNAKSLRKVVTEILSRNKKGVVLDALSKKVLATGYKSNSSNFKNVLYQCLYNIDDFEHDKKSGAYRLAPKTSKNGSAK